MNLSCLTCQGMKRTDSFADMERNMCSERTDNINKLLSGGVDNRNWSGNLVMRSNDTTSSSDEKNFQTYNAADASKKPTNSTRRVPVHSSGPLTKTGSIAMATRFNRSSSTARRVPVHRSGPLNRTNTTNAAASGTRLFGTESGRFRVHSNSGPIKLEKRTSMPSTTTTTAAAAAATEPPPKLVRCGGMRRDWSFEDVRQINSVKT